VQDYNSPTKNKQKSPSEHNQTNYSNSWQDDTQMKIDVHSCIIFALNFLKSWNIPLSDCLFEKNETMMDLLHGTVIMVNNGEREMKFLINRQDQTRVAVGKMACKESNL